MPLDDLARRSWPDPDAQLRKVLADPLFKQCAVELVEAALNAAGIRHGPITPETFASIVQRPEFQRRLQGVVWSVLAEQQRGWRA